MFSHVVQSSVMNPVFWKSNVFMACALIRGMTNPSTRKYIYSSSSSVILNTRLKQFVINYTRLDTLNWSSTTIIWRTFIQAYFEKACALCLNRPKTLSTLLCCLQCPKLTRVRENVQIDAFYIGLIILKRFVSKLAFMSLSKQYVSLRVVCLQRVLCLLESIMSLREC